MSEEVEEIREELLEEIAKLEEKISDIKSDIEAIKKVLRLNTTLTLRSIPVNIFNKEIVELAEELRKAVDAL